MLKAGEAALPAIRTRLLDRALSLGRVSRDPDPNLIVDGRVVRRRSVEGGVHRFAVPAGARQVAIASRSVVPSWSEAASLDPRRLGVPLERVVLSGDGLRIELAHDCSLLSDGFHADEWSHRWTNGCGVVPPQLVACFAEGFTIKVQIGVTELHYPLATLAEGWPIGSAVSAQTSAPTTKRRRRR